MRSPRLGTRLSNSVRQLLGGGQAWPIDNPNIDVQWKGVNIETGSLRAVITCVLPLPPFLALLDWAVQKYGRTIFFNYGWRGDACMTMPEGDQGTKEPALEEPLKAAFTDLDMKDVGSILVSACSSLMTLFAPPSHFPQEFPDCKGSNRRLFHDHRQFPWRQSWPFWGAGYTPTVLNPAPRVIS